MNYLRVKVCFKCHEFIPILEYNYCYKKEIDLFDSKHSGHPVQIINKEELKKISIRKELLKHLSEENSC